MRILVVDEQVLFRQSLASFLSCAQDIEVVGEADDGGQAEAVAKKVRPDIVLMEIRMPSGNGIEAIRRIKQEMPQVKIVALTVSDELNDLMQIVKNGADGYLLKSSTPEDLIAGLRQVIEGETALSPRMAAKIFGDLAQEPGGWRDFPRANHLSPREREILRLVAEGASNKEVGTLLCLSERTVSNHLHHIFGKLNLRNRVQAAIFAESHGLLSDLSQREGLGEPTPKS